MQRFSLLALMLALVVSVILCGCGGGGGGGSSSPPNNGGGGQTASLVQISPSPATLAITKTLTFSATVANNANQAVTWKVVESGGGTISFSGMYTAPATSGIYHVTATSVAEPGESATVPVTVQSGNEVIVIQ